MKRRGLILLTVLLTLVSTQLFARGLRDIDDQALEVALFHVNDTHAKLESSFLEFNTSIDDKLKNKRVFLDVGGLPSLWSAIDKLREQYPNNLFLHAGDVFQGTLYFTEFAGMADQDFFESMGLVAQAVGNHEFDKGPAILADYAETASYPLLACNLDLSAEPALDAVVDPYLIKRVGDSRVAIIGLVSPDTPYISSPGPNVIFLDAVKAVEDNVKALTAKGINKIIVLSHQGYDLDRALAAKVDGIDVIICAHSHTLLGEVSDIGLKPLGPYPTISTGPSNNKVLIVSAWQWAQVLGVLNVKFDAKGRITDYTGVPKFVAGLTKLRVYDHPDADGNNKRIEFSLGDDGYIDVKELIGSGYVGEPSASSRGLYLSSLQKLANTYADDPRFIFVSPKSAGVAKLAQYSPKIIDLKKKIVSFVAQDLKRGNDRGPGPAIADSMLWKTGADIAIMNPGGVRIDLPVGDLTVATVYELQPFGNTLVTMTMTGAEVIQALEDMVDFSVATYTPNTKETAYVYVSGLTMTLKLKNARGDRVKDVVFVNNKGEKAPLDLKATYNVVVNNFMGSGGDKNFTLGAIPASRKIDTGYIDSEAMLDWVTGKTMENIREKRVNIEL